VTPPHTGMTFFTPTGPCLPWFSPEFSAFTCTFVPCVTVLAGCYRAVLCVLRGRVCPVYCRCWLRLVVCPGRVVWSWSGPCGVITVNPWYYYRITLNTNTMEEHDIDALIEMRYGDDHLVGSDD